MSAPTLQSISLQDCDFVTDEGISLLAKNSPNLHYINISKCSRLTGGCLKALAKVSWGSGEDVVATGWVTK